MTNKEKLDRLIAYQKLSQPAHFMFGGHFPIICGIEGHEDPDFAVMKELVQAGLVISGYCGLTNRLHYLLTDFGAELHKQIVRKH